jgi:hypothetical protein
VFVVGADASLAYQYPLGGDLVKLCIDKLQSKSEVIEAHLGAPNGMAKQCADALLRADPFSIDEFLEQHPGFRDIGRMAIAFSLLECERADTFVPLMARAGISTWRTSSRGVCRQRNFSSTD